MEVFEYYGQVSEDGRLDLPEALKKRIGPDRNLRVMVFLEKNDLDWEKLSALKFFRGYDEEDGIYDEL